MKSPVLLLAAMLLSISIAFGQYKIGLVPRTSPDKSVYQKVGYTEVEVVYGSPSVKGRTVWGNLAPYDKVWRAGANNATTIRFSNPVTIEGQYLEAGTYALFVIVRELEPWTFVFNKNPKQWGAFRHNPDDDALRIDVFPFAIDHSEQLRYDISNLGFDYGQVQLNWGSQAIRFSFKTDYLEQFKSQVDSMAQGDVTGSWISWIQGAEYLVNINQDLPQALTWIEQAEAKAQTDTAWNEQYYPRHYVQGHLHWVKARVLGGMQHYAQALDEVTALKAITDSYNFYQKEAEEEGIDEKATHWLQQASK